MWHERLLAAANAHREPDAVEVRPVPSPLAGGDGGGGTGGEGGGDGEDGGGGGKESTIPE